MVKCELCGRDTPNKYLEKHHLKPKRCKDFVYVCCDCGDQLHKIFTNSEMQSKYNDLKIIKSDERIQKWVDWIECKRQFGFCMKSKKRKK